MPGELRDEGHRRLHPLHNQGVDGGHILCNERNEMVQIGSRRPAPLVEVYYNCQEVFLVCSRLS
jgi:hypothetical protein